MKRPWRYYFTYLWTFPYDLATWCFILLMWALWGTKLHWLEGVWFEFKKNSWPARSWYQGWAGTAIGHGGWLGYGYSGGSGIDTGTEYHEHHHTEQFEVSMLIGFLISCVVVTVLYLTGSTPNWWLVLGIWNLSWPVTVLCSMFQAWIRGEAAYKGSVLEEAAYSLTAEYERRKTGK